MEGWGEKNAWDSGRAEQLKWGISKGKCSPCFIGKQLVSGTWRVRLVVGMMFLPRSISMGVVLCLGNGTKVPPLLRSAGSKAPTGRGVLGSCWLSSDPGPGVSVNALPVAAHLSLLQCMSRHMTVSLL